MTGAILTISGRVLAVTVIAFKGGFTRQWFLTEGLLTFVQNHCCFAKFNPEYICPVKTFDQSWK